ncbi:transglycosylase SLT domain-containing protein [Holophaga foetida]|uniref:transglycosylase SLT domain-containing protein n=1 Tax=Holophaga foetida TaxID=35839 RepID=UPI0002474315|nr:transglycosylase SLT domain-containing protein [Holophaga foetida]
MAFSLIPHPSRVLSTAILSLLVLGLPLEARPKKRRPAPRASLKVDPLPARKALEGPTRWLLSGGLISGGHVSAAHRAQWPLWMQALCGPRRDVQARALAEADLDKVPDVFLVRAVDLLRERQVFTPRLLAQATQIGYTADAASWGRTRTAYQVAYLSTHPLPVQDWRTCSLLLSQLAGEGEAPLVRRLLQSSGFPGDAALNASFLRRLESQDDSGAAKGLVWDAGRPSEERFLALRRARLSDREKEALLPALKGTDSFGEAVLLGVQSGWITLASPRVDEAIAHPGRPKGQSPWFLVNLGERASDLLWMRAVDALQSGRWDLAERWAGELLTRFPDSWYAWHAAYLRSRSGDPQPHRLKIPGDITFCNAERLGSRMQPAERPWPEPFRSLAEQGRYDLILARVDPEKQTVLYLRAAHMAAQQDLVVRHFAIHKDCSPETLAFLYPTSPVPMLATLIREEGCEGIVDPAFVLAVMKNESQFQPSATSGAKAMGLLQLLKPTFVSMVGRNADIRDPETNIRAALRYFKRIAKTASLQGEPEAIRYAYIVAGYHAGEGRAKRWHAESQARFGSRTGPAEMLLRTEAIPFTSTRQYVLRVLGDRRLFRQVMR